MRLLAILILSTFALLPALAMPANAVTVHSERSLYRNIFVSEENGLRCLTFRRTGSSNRQTCVRIDDPKELVFSYTRMMLGSLYLQPNPARILIIGLGGGTLPMTLRDILPNAQIDVAEIDPAVIQVARKYFSFQPDQKMAVYAEDGRVFVKKQIAAHAQYDLVMLDAFEDDYIPEHLLTKEFLEEVKSIMTPHGVLAANTFSGSQLYPHESATYAAVFGPFYNLKTANRVIWAQLGGLTNMETVRANAARLEEKFNQHNVQSDLLFAEISTKADWEPSIRVLTDQYSPSNILNAR